MMSTYNIYSFSFTHISSLDFYFGVFFSILAAFAWIHDLNI